MLTPVETVKILNTHGDDFVIKAGEIIFEKGELGEVMYGILEGEVELFLGDKVVETIKTGDVFGEGALVQPDYLRATTAKAKVNCKLVTLDRERFLFAVQETPMFALEVLKSFSDRLRTLKSA